VKLQEILIRKGFTQAEIAREVGVSESKISRLLTGKTKNPSIAILYKIASLAGCEIGDILKEFCNRNAE
jgi:transcriptional regulator with XRE-family HTH domain